VIGAARALRCGAGSAVRCRICGAVQDLRCGAGSGMRDPRRLNWAASQAASCGGPLHRPTPSWSRMAVSYSHPREPKTASADEEMADASAVPRGDPLAHPNGNGAQRLSHAGPDEPCRPGRTCGARVPPKGGLVLEPLRCIAIWRACNALEATCWLRETHMSDAAMYVVSTLLYVTRQNGRQRATPQLPRVYVSQDTS
jgi:hypothetical protein